MRHNTWHELPKLLFLCSCRHYDISIHFFFLFVEIYTHIHADPNFVVSSERDHHKAAFKAHTSVDRIVSTPSVSSHSDSHANLSVL